MTTFCLTRPPPITELLRGGGEGAIAQGGAPGQAGDLKVLVARELLLGEVATNIRNFTG